MKKKKTLMFVLVLSLCVVAVSAVTSTATNYSMGNSFENGSYDGWTDLSYTFSRKEIKTEGSNHYLELSYGGGAREYYDVKPIQGNPTITGTIQAAFDIKFSEVDTIKNGQVQFKSYRGPGAADTTIAARIVKNYNRLQYDSNDSLCFFLTPSGEYLSIEAERWYSVTMSIDLQNNLQSIFIFDRDTNKMLARVENVALKTEITSINTVTFSGTTAMGIDNVDIGDLEGDKSYIYGQGYVERPKSGSADYKYSHYALTTDSSKILPMLNDTQWSLESKVSGVTLSSDGILTVSSDAQLRPVIIKAVCEDGKENKFIVNIRG